VVDLSQTQLAGFRAALLKRRDELEYVLDLSREGGAPVDLEEPIGRLSRMEAMQQQKIVQAGRAGQEAELRRVALALADMDSGDYGYCRQCDEPISLARLQIRPDTRICVPCQERRETP
jgi:DnaK suppressor protein